MSNEDIDGLGTSYIHARIAAKRANVLVLRAKAELKAAEEYCAKKNEELESLIGNGTYNTIVAREYAQAIAREKRAKDGLQSAVREQESASKEETTALAALVNAIPQ